MKKRLTLFSLLLLFTMTAMAQTLVDGIYYNLYEYNHAEVTNKPNGTKYSGDIVIPARISVDGVDYFVNLIGGGAFSYCSGLTSIEIPNSVTSIGYYAFQNCSGLTSIEIPNSVTSIRDFAFAHCDGLTSIEIPTSVTSIVSGAFSGCSGLTSIVVKEGNSYYDSRENCNAIIETSSNTLVASCQNTVIPNSVTAIGDKAFAYCSSLTSIDIPNSVTEIGDLAFHGCSSLTSIEIPNSVTRIGIRAFYNCSGLTSLTMQAVTPPATGSENFKECDNLETIFVPTGAKEAYNVAPWNAYNIVETEPNYEPRQNGTKTYNGRDVIAVKLTGEYSGEQVYTLTSAERNKDYTDVTDSVVFKVVSGEILTPVVDHEYNKNWGSWMHHAVYIDTDKNGFTGAIAEGSEWKPAGDLVTYSFYNNGAASDASGWNSVGEVISGDNRSNLPLPDFTAPTEPGIYRMRFVQDWCSIDPAGDADGKFGDFKSNGGQIVDVMLEVVEGIADLEPEPEVPATPVVITEVSQLSNAKCYTLVSSDTGRGGMYALADKVDMCGVTYSAGSDDCHKVERNAADPKQQFAFVEYEGKHYLYSVSEKKFVMKSGDTNALVGEAPYEFVTVEKVGENTFALKANDTHYFTASPGWCANPSRATCVQSTTSQSEGDGWDAGAWFTITEAGEFNPEEALAMLTQQDLNAELEAKLALLNEKIYQPIVEDFSNHGLLKSASQLSTNKQETKEGHISNLLDGDGNTFFHSTWSSVNTDNAYHFIQADLKQTVDSITVKYVRRNHSYNDSPKSIRVFATNNPAGDWDEIAVLESPMQQSYFGIILSGGTLNFNLGNKYRYVRFVVEETHSGQVNNDNLFFSWSEFGIWDNNGEEFLPEDKRTEINNVIATAKQELKDLAATQSTIDQLVEWAAYVDKYVFLTDGEAYTNATEQETERITYTREFKNTQWQSWYVPFDMDYNDISDEYTAACLNDIHEYDDDEDGVLDRWTMEVLILRPGETMYANLPYVIRAKEVGEKQFLVENTMLYPADEQSMDCSSMRMHYTFTGTYSPIEAQVLRDNGWLAMGNGRLVTPTTTSTLKANRWYLESTPRKGYGSTYQAPKRIELVVVDENGEVTGVEELPLTEDENAVWPADVYDLNGRLVKAQAKNLEDLPKGVYVVNGQKWVK